MQRKVAAARAGQNKKQKHIVKWVVKDSVVMLLGCAVLQFVLFSPVRQSSAQETAVGVFTESFADFESGKFDGWTIEGDAFGDVPATGVMFSGRVRGFSGKGFAATLQGRTGNASVGKAVSKSFVVTKPLVTFKIGGGRHPGKACLNLMVDDRIVRTETGDDSPQLITRTWDVSEFAGKTAHFEIVDETTSEERGYVLIDDIQLTGGEMVIMPPLAADAPWVEIPLRVVHIVDSQGKAEFSDRSTAVLTPAIVEKQIAAVNELYQATKIRFTFDPKDLEVRRDDYLNMDSDAPVAGIDVSRREVKPRETGQREHVEAFEAVGQERPDRLTILVHRGSEWRWDDRSQKWVSVVGFSRGGIGIRPDGRGIIRISATDHTVWAHELGHALGLQHISRDGVDAPSRITSEKEISRACQEYLARGGNPAHPENAIDGDYLAGIRDTPPDPGVGFWGESRELSRIVQITIPGREPFPLFVSRNNIMAPKAAVGGFTNGQIAVMRRIAEWWKEETSILDSGLIKEAGK